MKELPAAKAAAGDAASEETPLQLDATLIERVPEGTFGPYLGVAADGRALALWSALGDEGVRRWFSVALDAKRAPVRPARALLEAPGELRLAKLAPSREGFLALASSGARGETRVEALRLSGDGELLEGPVLLEQGRAEVVWIEGLSVGGSEVACWASVSGDVAELRLSRLGSEGKPALAPQRVLERAKAWQVVEFSDGLAIAAVVGAPGSGGSDVLRVTFLDTEGRLLRQTDVASGKRLEPQVDAARVGNRLVLAWVEREPLEQRLMLAAVGPDGRRTAAPERVPALGSQRLLGMLAGAAPGEGAWLAWEDLDQAPRGQRRFQLARVSADAQLGARRAELSFSGAPGERPELVRKGGGLALLTRAPACPRDARDCSASESVPVFVELGADLELLAAEPLRLAPEGGKVADLAWGLRCNGVSCAALGALPASPVPIYGIELRPRSQAWASPARALPSSAPRALDMRAVAETDPLAQVAAAPVGEGWLLGALTQFDERTPYVRRKTPAPDGRYGPVRAVLSVRPVGAAGGELGPPQVISYRARAPGGIALAPAPESRALLVWTALDRQRPEVFATVLGRLGQPISQRMLTQAAGQVSDVAGAVVPQGFIAAWIADPQGEPQVFAQRVGADLAAAAPPVQLSAEPGAAVALSLASHGGSVWLAWVQGGEHEQRLSTLRLDPKTGARFGEERLIQRTEGGSFRSPVLVPRGEGAWLGWVERPPVGTGDGRAWLVELDGEGAPRGTPRAVRSDAGDVAALRLWCDREWCGGSLDCRPPSGPLLEGFVWQPGSAPAASQRSPELRTTPLVRRATAPADPPALALAGRHIFYADRREQRGLLRRVAVEWP